MFLLAGCVPFGAFFAALHLYIVCLRNVCFLFNHTFMLTNSPKKAVNKKKGVGTILFYPIGRLLALPKTRDKTIAHTKGYVKSQYRLYKPMMRCYCLLPSCLGKFCENLPMKIISITPFIKKLSFWLTR